MGNQMLKEEEKPVDLRIRRTRHLLQQAFMELMAEKDFQSITVQDIANRAMVNRATFYDHFVDKYALLTASITDLFKKTLHNSVSERFDFTTQNLQRLLETVYDFMAQVHGHCSPKDQQLLLLIESQITSLVAEVLLTWLRDKQPDALRNVPAEMLAASASWAIYGAAMYWNQKKGGQNEFVTLALPIATAILGQPGS
jgi:AcrR family transcriptional regulator